MPTNHDETLQLRYLREYDEYVARIESMTTGQIMALDVQLADVTAQRDQLLEALECLFSSYKQLAYSGDAGNWSLEDTDEGKKALSAIAAVKGD